ncbi:MAG: acetolactate synthase large subunit [Candidatus Solibacter sp.]|nr:acetolactate synthase large subunit [Candidatus Solibacter sp.]
MTGAHCLLESLAASSIRLCFMNPGTSEMQFVSELDRVHGVRGVLCLHETVCAGAADGYARITRRPAATLLHLGPGLANALSNFHNARKARSPIVNIVGEHSTRHLAYDAPLTANIEALAATVSGFTATASTPASLGPLTAKCIAAALAPPGQVATLIVPADISWLDGASIAPPLPHTPRTVPDESVIAQARQWLSDGSPCGIILSGRALLEDSLAAAARITAATGARIFANRYAARLPRGLGGFNPTRLPYFPEPAEAALAGLHRIILVEAAEPVSFFGYPNRRSTLAPPACQFMTLASETEDSLPALIQLASLLPQADPLPSSELRPTLPSGGPLSPDSIGRTLAALLPDNSIVSDEMISSGEAVNGWLLRAARHQLLPVTGGSIGQGLPVAVGAALASPGSKVLALQADGSGMYSLQALWTMARENLNILTVIFANRRYRILDVEMERTGAATVGPLAGRMLDLADPDLDWVSLARGHGVDAVRVSSLPQFIACAATALNRRGPFLIEAVLD